MKIITTLFSLIFILFVGGIIFLIFYVIKKSTEKKSDGFNRSERYEMMAKLETTRKKLVPWRPEFLQKISNNMPHTYKKFIHNEFNGKILSNESDSIIAFRMIDRGLTRDCKIAAGTSSDTYYMEADDKRIVLYVNKVFIGTVVNENRILSKDGEEWGRVEDEGELFFQIRKGEDVIAQVIKNSDRRETIRNPFYKSGNIGFPTMFSKEMMWKQDVANYGSMLNVKGTHPKDDLDRILSIALFYMIYAGIDFTR